MSEGVISTYDKWITLKKVLLEGIIVAIIAFGTYMIEIGFPGLISGYPAYAFIISAIAAIVAGFINWLKHRNDTKIIEK